MPVKEEQRIQPRMPNKVPESTLIEWADEFAGFKRDPDSTGLVAPLDLKKNVPDNILHQWAQEFGYGDVGESTAMGRITDAGIDAAKGVVQLGKSAVGISDLLTGNLVGKVLDLAGYDPDETIRVLESGYSPTRKRSQAAVAETTGFFDTIKALWKHPSVAVGAVLESAPLTMTGMGAARTVATRLFASELKKKGIAAGSKAASEFGKTFFRDPKVIAKVVLAGGLAEGTMEAGLRQEELRGEGKTWAESIPFALGTGAGTALIAILSNKVPGFRGMDAEAMIALSGYGSLKSLRKAGKDIAKTLFKEGVLEELPQEAQQQVWENLALGRPWDEGVSKAGAMGMVVGALQGGGAAVISSAMGQRPETGVTDTAPAKPMSEVTPEIQQGLTGLAVDDLFSLRDSGQVEPLSPLHDYINQLIIEKDVAEKELPPIELTDVVKSRMGELGQELKGKTGVLRKDAPSERVLEAQQAFVDQAEQEENQVTINERMRRSPEGRKLLREQLDAEEKGEQTPFQRLVVFLDGFRGRLREQSPELTQSQIEDREFAEWQKKADQRIISDEEYAQAKKVVDRLEEDDAFRQWHIESQKSYAENDAPVEKAPEAVEKAEPIPEPTPEGEVAPTDEKAPVKPEAEAVEKPIAPKAEQSTEDMVASVDDFFAEDTKLTPDRRQKLEQMRSQLEGQLNDARLTEGTKSLIRERISEIDKRLGDLPKVEPAPQSSTFDPASIPANLKVKVKDSSIPEVGPDGKPLLDAKGRRVPGTVQENARKEHNRLADKIDSLEKFLNCI